MGFTDRLPGWLFYECYSKAEWINKVVKEMKTSATLPNRVDEATTLVDITAEPNAIRGHYILSGIDAKSVTKNALRSYLSSTICHNKDTQNLLDQGINMEYSYTVEGTAQKYFLSFTKTDCL